MASVVGLAPTRFGLKGRSLGLLCIHGQIDAARWLRAEWIGVAFGRALHVAFCIEWSPRLALRQRLLVFSEALICLSYLGVLKDGDESGPSAW